MASFITEQQHVPGFEYRAQVVLSLHLENSTTAERLLQESLEARAVALGAWVIGMSDEPTRRQRWRDVTDGEG